MVPDSLRQLLSSARIGALAVVADGQPLVAMAGMVVTHDFRAVLVHLSRLSAHRQALSTNPTCALLLHEPDDGRPQPLLLGRVSLQGTAEVVERSHPSYESTAAQYLARLPASRMMFSLGDFDLLRVTISTVRYVAGFGQAFSFSPDELIHP
jgi:putative heme iron utilization protein